MPADAITLQQIHLDMYSNDDSNWTRIITAVLTTKYPITWTPEQVTVLEEAAIRIAEIEYTERDLSHLSPPRIAQELN